MARNESQTSSSWLQHETLHCSSRVTVRHLEMLTGTRDTRSELVVIDCENLCNRELLHAEHTVTDERVAK